MSGELVCFWTEPTGESEIVLRRYTWADSADGCAGGDHLAREQAGRAAVPIVTRDDGRRVYASIDPAAYAGDPRWPSRCGCGYEFTDTDERDIDQEPIYRRPDTGEEWRRRYLPPGALYDAWWYSPKGPDGLCVTVICPDGSRWIIDSRASNCGFKNEPEAVDLLELFGLDPDQIAQARHHCWIRHGDPRTEPVTVDKDGFTCQAGGGSIQTGTYHGFLTAGSFRPC